MLSEEGNRISGVPGETMCNEQRSVRWQPLLVILSVFAILVGLIVYWAFFQREHSAWSEVVTLWDGRTLSVQQFSSQRVFHGHPHGPISWGGGDPWSRVTFAIDGKTCHWEGKYIPIAVQVDGSDAYIVVFDRESDWNHLGFRIYRAATPSEWDEIAPEQFPKHLAIQNTWLRENNGVGMDGKVLNDYEVVSKMAPEVFWFRESLTAKLWKYLAAPEEFDFDETPSEDFVRQFKTRWIREAGNGTQQQSPSSS